MNPYNVLNKVAGVLSMPAVLVTKSGDAFSLYVRPETRTPENIQSDYAAALLVRSWSYNIEEVSDVHGNTVIVFPDSGDVLRVEDKDGVIRDYRTTRDAKTSKYWTWKFDRPGCKRVVFYTKYEPN